MTERADATHGLDGATPPSLERYLSTSELVDLIQRAKAEDLGPDGRDVTSSCMVPVDQACEARFRPRQGGRLAGAAVLPAVIRAYDPKVRLGQTAADGDTLRIGDTIATLTGPLRSVLAIERVALNFMTHLSGIATLTAAFVEAVRGTSTKILDTRKTLPGLRVLQKYAVACGGGANHRMGLYDAVLVKDNHIAHLGSGLVEALRTALTALQQATPPPAFVEVEVDTLDQLESLLTDGQIAGRVDIVLLDNMGTESLSRAVVLRDRLAPRVLLEASGGVRLDTVRQIAETGVDRISVGALTHSPPALDMGLDIA